MALRSLHLSVSPRSAAAADWGMKRRSRTVSFANQARHTVSRAAMSCCAVVGVCAVSGRAIHTPSDAAMSVFMAGTVHRASGTVHPDSASGALHAGGGRRSAARWTEDRCEVVERTLIVDESRGKI